MVGRKNFGVYMKGRRYFTVDNRLTAQKFCFVPFYIQRHISWKYMSYMAALGQ